MYKYEEKSFERDYTHYARLEKGIPEGPKKTPDDGRYLFGTAAVIQGWVFHFLLHVV